MQVGFRGGESLGFKRHISLHIFIFFPSPTAWRDFLLSFPLWQKKFLCMGTRGNSWVTFHKFSSTPRLAHGFWEWLWDSPSLPGNTGTALWRAHLCSPIPSAESPRRYQHCRAAASSELRLTSLRQSTWNKIKWTNTGFNWDSQLQFKAECQQAEPDI